MANVTVRKLSPEELAKERLQKVVSELLQKYENTTKAAEALAEKGRNDPDLYKAITGPGYWTACYTLVSSALGESRTKAWGGARVTKTLTNTQADSNARMQIVATAMLLDFPLYGGLLLRNANRAEVEESANRYEATSTDMALKSKWLRLIAKGLQGDKTVGATFNEKKLAALREQAAKEVG